MKVADETPDYPGPHESVDPAPPVRRKDGTFARGSSGNPGGNAKNDPLSVLRWAKKILKEDPERARRIADKWLTKMEEDPNAQGIATLFERQDGKVVQPIDHTHLLPALSLRDRTKVDPRLPPSVADADDAEFEVKE